MEKHHRQFKDSFRLQMMSKKSKNDERKTHMKNYAEIKKWFSIRFNEKRKDGNIIP